LVTTPNTPPLSLADIGGKMSNSWFSNSNKGPITEEFELDEELGRGASAVVHSATQYGTGIKFAVKEMTKTKEQCKAMKAEVKVLLTLSHPNIIKYYRIYETPTEVSLVLEYVDGGELFDRIVQRGYYSERDASTVVRQILEALKYLHDKDIVHRDLKPENLLFSDQSDSACLKVADFGLAQIDDSDTQLKTICGTPGYVAPEVLLGKNYSKAVDIWAVGVITYILLCGFEPFYDEGGDQQMFQKIIRGNFEFTSPWWDGVSENAKDLVRRMLTLNPTKRITAVQALHHPWVQGKAANFQHMEKAMGNLREFNAKRKIKGVFQMVSAAARLSDAKLS